MDKNTTKENRALVLESIADIQPDDEQIIELLLLLADDWELRAAVMKVRKGRSESGKGSEQKVVQTFSNGPQQPQIPQIPQQPQQPQQPRA